MRNLNLDQLQTLIAIADLGTIAAAARALHLAPPTVSLHIKELEARLETSLLVRGRRQVELTVPGALLVEEGRKLLTASDDLADRVQRCATGREGIVRIGVSAGVSNRLLPQMLKALSQSSPGIEVRLEAVGSADALLRLKSGTLDVGIVANSRSYPEVRMVPWRNDPMVALVPAAWEAPRLVTPEWLANRRWASFSPATQMHGLVAGWFGRAGFNPRPFLTLSYPGALKSLASASQSAVLLPMEEVEDERGSAEVTVHPLFPTLMRPMYLAHRHTPEPSGATKSVLSMLASFANGSPCRAGEAVNAAL